MRLAVFKAAVATVYIVLASTGSSGHRDFLPVFLGISVLVLIGGSIGYLIWARHNINLLVLATAVVLDIVALLAALTAAYYRYGGNAGEIPKIHTHLDALYFTVTVLSTVGFGDIVAVGQGARLVVTIQMIFDFAYLASAIGLLLSVFAEYRRPGAQP
jgi:voltage-gated potassium channel